MTRREIIGGALALKGAGLVGTFCLLDGIRLLDGPVVNFFIWLFILAGWALLIIGLGYAASAASDDRAE
ncbi:MAG: hypothetical protein ACFCUX_03460 [Candidatus Methylacidiphilales bacterium]